MNIKQLSIFVENKEGKLAFLTPENDIEDGSKIF